MGPMGTYRIFGKDFPLGGMFVKPPMMSVCCWMYYFRVEDCDAAAEKAQQLGAKLVNGPMEVPDGDRVAQLMDPTGAMFALHASKQA